MSEKKVALIIGGTSDIGQAIIKVLEVEYQIYFTYFSNDELAKRTSGVGMHCDIQNIRSIRMVFRQFPKLDLMVTCAFPFIENDVLEFSSYLETEPYLRGHVVAVCEAAKKMNSGGKVINLLGQCVDRGLAGAPYYAAAYAYLRNLAMSINASHGRAGRLSVHDILLGPVNTKLWRGVSKEVMTRYRNLVARFIEPREVAEAVLYIARSEIGPTTFKLDAFYSL